MQTKGKHGEGGMEKVNKKKREREVILTKSCSKTFEQSPIKSADRKITAAQVTKVIKHQSVRTHEPKYNSVEAHSIKSPTNQKGLKDCCRLPNDHHQQMIDQ